MYKHTFGKVFWSKKGGRRAIDSSSRRRSTASGSALWESRKGSRRRARDSKGAVGWERVVRWRYSEEISEARWLEEGAPLMNASQRIGLQREGDYEPDVFVTPQTRIFTLTFAQFQSILQSFSLSRIRISHCQH